MSQHGASQLSPILNKNSINKNFILLRFDEIIVSFLFKICNMGVQSISLSSHIYECDVDVNDDPFYQGDD